MAASNTTDIEDSTLGVENLQLEASEAEVTGAHRGHFRLLKIFPHGDNEDEIDVEIHAIFDDAGPTMRYRALGVPQIHCYPSGTTKMKDPGSGSTGQPSSFAQIYIMC